MPYQIRVCSSPKPFQSFRNYWGTAETWYRADLHREKTFQVKIPRIELSPASAEPHGGREGQGQARCSGSLSGFTSLG